MSIENCIDGKNPPSPGSPRRTVEYNSDPQRQEDYCDCVPTVHHQLIMKTNDRVAERTIDIYLQIAETARLSGESNLVDCMLLAAYEEIAKSDFAVAIKAQTRLAELLTIQNHLTKAEEIFTLALKNATKNSADIWLQARIHDGLAEVYIRLSDLHRARRKCQQAIRIIGKITGCDPSLLLSRKRKLALINMLLGHDVGAEEVGALLRFRTV